MRTSRCLHEGIALHFWKDLTAEQTEVTEICGDHSLGCSGGAPACARLWPARAKRGATASSAANHPGCDLCYLCYVLRK
jgi:hypothetical protein